MIELSTDTQPQFELGDTAEDIERKRREKEEGEERDEGERMERDGGEREKDWKQRR